MTGLDGRLSGRVALVTSAGAGIGRARCRDWLPRAQRWLAILKAIRRSPIPFGQRAGGPLASSRM
jgi:NAD(P)-dependent dehydrogenase (short-subunit alcohol dehydrogenase family)